MAQNQEHRFVPALVDRVGYPVWSAAVLSDLPEKPDGKLLLIPFVKFDESEVQAVLSAIFTSEEEDPYILLGEKSALLSLIPYVPEEQLGHTKLSVLATLLLDDELFSHTDETLLAWIKGQLAESDDDDFMDDLDFRCLGVVVIDICGPINTTIQVLKEDEIEVRFDCVSYTVDLGCGGGGGSWWGSAPSSGNGGSNPDGGIFTGGGTPSGPLSNAGSISLSGFNGISNLHELLQTCAVSGEGHEPGHNAELGGVCDGLNQILDVFGLEDIGWLLNSRRDLFDQLSAWLKLNDDPLSHQAAWSYVRYVQSGGTLPFREFAGPFISITSWAAEVGITLSDDQFRWLLENLEGFEGIQILQDEAQFNSLELQRILQYPELFDEVHAFFSEHNYEGASENEVNLAAAVSKAYTEMYEEFEGSLLMELGDGPLRDIMLEMLWEVVKELVIDFIPGGTLATMGPELFENLQEGQWMDAMFNAVDIALNEADAFFPQAKVASFALGAYVKGKHLKRAFKAFEKAKSLGEDFLIGLYNVFRNRLNWPVSKVRDKFQWLGGVNAKMDDASGSVFFEKLKEEFGTFTPQFLGINGNPVFKILELPYEPNHALYMELYPDANSGWNWTIEISKGARFATSYTQLVSKFKIRFDF